MNQSIKDTILTLTRSLVSFHTIEDQPLAHSHAFSRVEEFFQSLNLRTHRSTSNGIQTILYTPQKVKRPRILFCGHLDIVPCHPSQLHLTQENDILFGRGTYDMKGPIAALMVAMQTVLLKDPTASVGLLLSSDEEVGGANGVGTWIEQFPELLPEVVFIPDGGSAFTLVTEEKGVLQIEVKVIGKTGHASRPWEGKNAISLAAEGLKKVARLFPELKRITDWRTSVTPTKLTSGTAINQIPGEAAIAFDIRHVPRDTREQILLKIQSCFPDQVIRILHTGDPFFLPPKTSAIALLRSIYLQQFNKPLPEMHFPSACDARFFAAKNIPVILLRSSGGDAHGPKEWVSLEGLEEYAHLVSSYTQAYLTNNKI